jgi:hypothetical protein
VALTIVVAVLEQLVAEVNVIDPEQLSFAGGGAYVIQTL